jgi:hypothetical protein
LWSRIKFSILVPYPSFDHNSCTSSLNKQCEGTLSIYTSSPFQWYPKCPIWCLFDFSTKALNIWDSHTSVIPKVGVHLGIIGLHLLHSPSFVGTNILSWPHEPLDSTFNHEPNVRVTITIVVDKYNLSTNKWSTNIYDQNGLPLHLWYDFLVGKICGILELCFLSK